MMGMVTLLGAGIVRATGATKLLNVSSNAASLLLFILSGLVVWPVGLVMAAGSFTGAQLGLPAGDPHGGEADPAPPHPGLRGGGGATAGADPANPLRRAALGF